MNLTSVNLSTHLDFCALYERPQLMSKSDFVSTAADVKMQQFCIFMKVHKLPTFLITLLILGKACFQTQTIHFVCSLFFPMVLLFSPPKGDFHHFFAPCLSLLGSIILQFLCCNPEGLIMKLEALQRKTNEGSEWQRCAVVRTEQAEIRVFERLLTAT